MILELERGRKFSGEQLKTIECLCHGTIGLIVAPWKFDVLKSIIFALEDSLLGQIFVLRTSNLLSADSSATETLYCLNRITKE